MKRTLRCALVLTIMLSLLVGLSVGAESPAWDVSANVDENFPLDQYISDLRAKWYPGRDVEMSWYFFYPHFSATKKWSEYTSTKTLVDITGVDIASAKPDGDPTEKFNTMLATNDIPEIITVPKGDTDKIATLIDSGFVLCLEDLAGQYASEWVSTELDQDLVIASSYDSDGKMWGIAGVVTPEFLYESKSGLGGAGYNVRKDIWMEMGQPSISTPDELYNVLKRFRETYPEMNGKTSIGISGWDEQVPNSPNAMVNTMGYSFGIQEAYYDAERDVCTLNYYHPRYLEFLQYMNKLYNEGLIDPEVFVKNAQQTTEDLSTCSFMIPFVFWGADMGANAALEAETPGNHFIQIAPMSAEGEQFKNVSLPRLGSYMTFITKSCKDPEAALNMLRFIYTTEGALQVGFGNPGQHYLVNDGVVERSPGVMAGWEQDRDSYDNIHAIWQFYAVYYQPLPTKNTEYADRQNYDRKNADTNTWDATNLTYNMRASTVSDAGIAWATCQDIAKREVVAAITASSPEDVQTIYTNMLARFESVGIDLVNEFQTEQYHKNVEKFGEPKY